MLWKPDIVKYSTWQWIQISGFILILRNIHTFQKNIYTYKNGDKNHWHSFNSNTLQSAASGTLLLTAANLATLAAIHPPTVTAAKPMDTASVASSTHFTVINGIGRPTTVYKKSWCARNQLTVLVCTMCILFMIGLLAGVLYMEGKLGIYISEIHSSATSATSRTEIYLCILYLFLFFSKGPR